MSDFNGSFYFQKDNKGNLEGKYFNNGCDKPQSESATSNVNKKGWAGK